MMQYKYVSNPVDCSAVRRGSSFKNMYRTPSTAVQYGGVRVLKMLLPFGKNLNLAARLLPESEADPSPWQLKVQTNLSALHVSRA